MPDRFWSRVERQKSGCWVWKGPVGTLGFGNCARQGVHGAHKVSRLLMGETIPARLRNVCGNRLCVRPDHWDADESARAGRRRAKAGQQEEMVRKRHAGISVAEIAAQAGVSRATVWRALKAEEGGM